jgi:hypothetical protein
VDVGASALRKLGNSALDAIDSIGKSVSSSRLLWWIQIAMVQRCVNSGLVLRFPTHLPAKKLIIRQSAAIQIWKKGIPRVGRQGCCGTWDSWIFGHLGGQLEGR